MTPDAEQSLSRARADLDDARKIATFPIARFAARAAYSAAFYAAEAYIVARTGKIAKTHSGVRSEFNRLIQDEVGDLRELGRILKDGYHFKEIADYWTDSENSISDQDAEAMIADAQHFIDRVAALLAAPHPGAKG